MPNSEKLINTIEFQLPWLKMFIERLTKKAFERGTRTQDLDLPIKIAFLLALKEIAEAAGIEFNEDDFDPLKIREKLSINAGNM